MPVPPANWARIGSVYPCRTPRTAQEGERLGKFPGCPDPRWAGVVCFKGTDDPRRCHTPWVSNGGERCLDYGPFAVYGDPEVLREVRTILDAEGFPPPRDP